MMSSTQPYRERERAGDRERDPGYNRSRGGPGGGFRGRGGPGGQNKPRRYWDNDEYYKDERDQGRRRRRSYSRSRSRSYSRSRSRTPPSRRGRSRTPPRVADISHRGPPEPARMATEAIHEPYVPTREPSSGWTETRMQIPQEYVPQTNGQAPRVATQMNMYTTAEATAYPQHYQENQHGMASMGNPSAIPYGYGYTQYPPPQTAPQMYPPPGGAVQPVAPVAPPPPSLGDPKPAKDEGSIEGSKKKKDKNRKKKKRRNSSSSSSSSSDESSGSRRRRKSKKDASSDSSSEEEKKDKSGLTSAQVEALSKQRGSYQTKLEILEREISKLKSKEEDLVRNRADRQLIEENLALQAELKGRCKAVVIVLEKIDDVLEVNKSKSTKVEKTKPEPSQELYAQQPLKATMAVSDSVQPGDALKIGSFDYYDNGKHWCRLCNVFPETVENLLKHYHSKEHHDQIQQLGIDEKPWHKRNSVSDSKSMSGARKAPFRGMQFFSPVEGWYCRLCNNWMGDPHCAVEHLKSDEHNSNYMNFLEEQPGWEQKWITDRDKAYSTSGKKDTVKKSRFDEPRFVNEIPERMPPVPPAEDLESGKSIRVQMRNSMKTEERSNDAHHQSVHLSDSHKDSGLEEWMNKPKVTVDIIDTQKFAAIVRQKHGSKDKDPRVDKDHVPEVKMVPPPAPVPPPKEKDYKKEREERRRPDKVELQISSRDRDRDRHRDTRDRDSRNSRRRSRSRSRSRDRRYNRRRSRSRSRSRSRDRSDRDRRDRDRDRPEIKEAVKKLPMIGKMPLYKRPAVSSRDKQDPDKGKSSDVSPKPPISEGDKTDDISKNETVKAAEYNETQMDVSSGYGYDAHAYDQSMAQYGMSAAYGQVAAEMYIHQDVPKSYQPAQPTEDVPGEDPKETKEDGPAALPDDFQQALDIIYAPPGVPQPVPPPSANGMDEAVAVDPADYDYANGYGYMGYQPYQQSFDGYAPVGYEDLDDGPPGVSDGKPAAAPSDGDKAAEEEPLPPGDDMEDLRMLGIDVEDTAVVVKN